MTATMNMLHPDPISATLAYSAQRFPQAIHFRIGLLVLILHALLLSALVRPQSAGTPPITTSSASVIKVQWITTPEVPNIAAAAKPHVTQRQQQQPAKVSQPQPVTLRPNPAAIAVAPVATTRSEIPPVTSTAEAQPPYSAPENQLSTPARYNANYLNNPAPIYPPTARRRGEQGRVMLRVQVSSSGQAQDVQLYTSSGSSALDDAAIQAVRRWRFVPAKQGETPIAAWVQVPILFQLEQSLLSDLKGNT